MGLGIGSVVASVAKPALDLADGFFLGKEEKEKLKLKKEQLELKEKQIRASENIARLNQQKAQKRNETYTKVAGLLAGGAVLVFVFK